MKAVICEQAISADLMRRIGGRLETAWELEPVEASDTADKLARIRDAQVLIGHEFDASMLNHPPDLRLIQATSAGINAIAVDAIPPGVPLCNVYEHEVPIAEYVMMGLLMCITGVKQREADLRRGRWTGSGRVYGAFHDELFGKTLGLIGYGRIGREVAARARAFGMRIVALRRDATRDDTLDATFGYDRPQAFFAQCDHFVVSCPLTKQTDGMIGQAELACMKPTAVIVNPSRGEIIQEKPLYDALAKRRIAGAVLDTWYRYPAAGEIGHGSDRPFHELDNVVITPHFAAWTEAMVDRRMSVVAANLDRLSRGQPLVNRVPTPTGSP